MSLPNIFKVMSGVLLLVYTMLVQPVFSADLPVQYALDEGGGTVATDSGGMGNDGVLIGAPIYATETADGSAFSLQFDRLNDRIDLGALDATGSQLTLAAWIKAESFPGSKQDPHIISKSFGNSISNTIFVLGTVKAASGVRLRVRLRTGGSTTTLRADPGYDLDPGQWYHTAATYDGVTLRLYIDGVEVGSRSLSGTIDQAPGISVAVGSQPSGGRYFHGHIDDVRILNESLTPAQIQAIVDGVPPSDPPEANPENYTTTEDSQLVIDTANGVLANDIDPENDLLTSLLLTGTTSGTIVLETDGSFVYTPGNNFSGVDSFVYRASDGSGVSDETVVTIDVMAINDNPVASDDFYDTNYATPLAANVLDNDFDVDDDSLTVGLSVDTRDGELILQTDGSFTYSPDEGFSGQDSFTYIAIDANSAASNEATVTITVKAEGSGSVPGSIVSLRFEEGAGTVAVDSSGQGNDGIILGNPEFTTSTGNASAYALNFDGSGDSVDLGVLDVVGSELTLAAWFQATSFPGRAQDPRIISKASGSAANSHIFMLSTVKAASGVRLRARLRIGGQTRTLRADPGSELSPGNWYHAAFTYDGSSMRIFLDGQLVGSQALSGSIDQDSSMGVAVGSQPGGGRHFNGSIDDAHILDVALDSAQLQMLINGSDANNLPVAVADSYSAVEDQALSIDQSIGVLVNDTDTENDVLSANLITNATHGLVVLDSEGSFVYTPEADFSGIDAFSYNASDGAGESNIASVSISVAAVNDRPVAINDNFSTAFETDLVGNVLVNDFDADGDNLTALLESSPNNGSIEIQENGDFVYSPNDGFSGLDSFSYTVSDTAMVSSEATVNITVQAVVSEGPIISSASSINVDENQTTVVDVESSGTGLDFSLTGGVDQALFMIDADTGALTFIAAPDFESPSDADADNNYEVQVTVTDSNELTDDQSITISVLDVPESPIISSASSINVDENQTSVVDVESSGAGLDFSLTGGVDQALFMIDADTGVLTFIAAPDFESPSDADADNNYEVQVTVTDSNELTDDQSITISVLDVPESPIISSASSINVDENQTSAVDVESSGTGLIFSLSGGADQTLFTINADTGVLTFITAPDFESPGDADADNNYEVQVTVTDSNGLTVDQAITISVLDVPEGPIIILSASSVDVNENQISVIDVDSTGSGLSFSLTGGVDVALFDIDSSTGVVTFKSAPDFEVAADNDADNIYEIVVTVGDLSDPVMTANQLITITVLDVEENGNLLVHLEFDDDLTPFVAADSSGNGNDGVISGATYISDSGDVSGSSLAFDGNNDVVSLGNLDVNGTGLTVAAWIYADSFPGSARDPRIVSKASGGAADEHVFMFGTIRSGLETVLRARVRVGGNTTTLVANANSLTTGVWYHTAMVFDESELTLYLNGAKIDSTAVSGPLDQDNSVEVSVGSQPNGGKYWDGLIDNVHIANRAFSAGEIAELAFGDPDATTTAVADSYIADFETQLEVSASAGVLANDIPAGEGVFIASLVSDVNYGSLTLNIDGSFSYAPSVGFSGIDSFEYIANNSAPATVILNVGVPELPVGNGVYDSDQEVTYKEYWISHEWFTAGGDCGAFPFPPGNKWFIEPVAGILNACPMFFDIDEDFSNAIRAEVYMDIWRGRTDSAVRFNLNGGVTRVPDVGAEYSRTPYVEEIPLSELILGENVLNLWRSGGQYHIHDIAIRIYHSAGRPLLDENLPVEAPQANLVSIQDDNGLFTDMSAGGELYIENDNLTLTAFASGDARFIEFHAYYDGYDEDNDGLTLDWHNRTRNNWHPGGRNPQVTGGTIDHIGTKAVTTSGNYSIDWDVSLIPAQANVRFKVRVVDGGGNVRDAAGGPTNGFHLKRTTTMVDTFSIDNFVDAILQAGGSQPPEIYRTISLPQDLSIYTEATIVASYWSNPLLSINGNPAFYAFDECAGSPCNNTNSHWQLSVRSIPISYLQGGDNQLHYQHNAGFGEFIEKPGPMIVLRGPKQPNILPIANNDSYDVVADQPFTVAAAIGVLANDTDVDGDMLTAVLGSNVSNGVLSLNDDGSFDYTPNAGYVGSDTFTYYANDGTEDSSMEATVNLLITEEVVDSDLLVHLEFEDFQSPLGAVDSSTYGNFGAVFGAEYVSNTGDGSLYSMEFSGDDTIDLANINVAGNGLTLAAWINADTFPGQSRDPRIISKASGTAVNDHVFMLSTIKLGTETVLRARIRVGGSTTTLIANAGTSLSTDNWHHVAVTYDGTEIVLFLDGVEVGNTALSGSVAQDSSVSVAVGSQPSGSNAFDGKIDDVRILQRALSPLEINAIVGVPAPQNLVAQSVSATEIELTWTAVTEASEYHVYRDGELIATVSETSYIDDTVVAGVGYSYQVLAANSEGVTSSATDTYLVNFVSSQGPWWDNAWNYRLGVFVDSGDTARENAVVTVSVDFDALIVEAGGTEPHDASKVRCVEVTSNGELVDEETRCQSGDGELVLLLSGATAESTSRFFHVYYDIDSGGVVDNRLPLVELTENASDENFDSLEIETNTAILNYHIGGAGFSSFVDNDENDWIDYNAAGGSSGVFRGIPNLVPPADGGYFHPGPGTASTTVLDSGPIRVRFESVTDDGAWRVRWDVYPNYLAFAVLEKPATDYWFLYEGTPGGLLDTADFTVRSSGTSSTLGGFDTWGEDLPAEEWVMVSASEVPRSLFVAKQNDDNAFDSYRPASLSDGLMTILGFGRNGIDAELSDTDDLFFVGFLETQNFTTAKTSILSIIRTLDVNLSSPAIRP